MAVSGGRVVDLQERNPEAASIVLGKKARLAVQKLSYYMALLASLAWCYAVFFVVHFLAKLLASCAFFGSGGGSTKAFHPWQGVLREPAPERQLQKKKEIKKRHKEQ